MCVQCLIYLCWYVCGFVFVKERAERENNFRCVLNTANKLRLCHSCGYSYLSKSLWPQFLKPLHLLAQDDLCRQLQTHLKFVIKLLAHNTCMYMTKLMHFDLVQLFLSF